MHAPVSMLQRLSRSSRGASLSAIRCRFSKAQRSHSQHVRVIGAKIHGDGAASSTSDVLSLAFDDGHAAQAHAMWLRHNCPLYFSSSGQRIVPITDIPALPLSSLRLAAPAEHGRALNVEFNDGHRTRFAAQWLRDFAFSGKASQSVPLQPLPLQRDHVTRVSFDDFLGNGCDGSPASDSGLFQILHAVAVQGVALLTAVPCVSGTVREVCARIALGAPMSSIYGTVFDVISTENPINIAYSNIALDLHQDLPYYESPPGVQLLHCLKFGATVSGGETFLADAFAVARRLRDFDPALLHALARQPVTFSKVHFERQYPASLQYRRPVIVLNQDRAVPGTPASQPEIVSVNWSPQFEAPLHIDPNEAALFYEAYRLMSQFMSEAPQLKLRLNEGEVLIFNNRRMVHGRCAFECPRGESRHLQGAYINVDDFRNRHAVVGSRFGTSYARAKDLAWGHCSLMP